MAKRKFTAGALFSGIGGLCLGFEQGGFKTRGLQTMMTKWLKPTG